MNWQVDPIVDDVEFEQFADGAASNKNFQCQAQGKTSKREEENTVTRFNQIAYIPKPLLFKPLSIV